MLEMVTGKDFPKRLRSLGFLSSFLFIFVLWKTKINLVAVQRWFRARQMVAGEGFPY